MSITRARNLSIPTSNFFLPILWIGSFRLERRLEACHGVFDQIDINGPFLDVAKVRTNLDNFPAHLRWLSPKLEFLQLLLTSASRPHSYTHTWEQERNWIQSLQSWIWIYHYLPLIKCKVDEIKMSVITFWQMLILEPTDQILLLFFHQKPKILSITQVKSLLNLDFDFKDRPSRVNQLESRYLFQGVRYSWVWWSNLFNWLNRFNNSTISSSPDAGTRLKISQMLSGSVLVRRGNIISRS